MYQALTEVWQELTAPGGAFEVETLTVRGNPMRAFKHAPATVRDLWLGTADFAERDYLIYNDERLTYADTHANVAAIAAWLTRQGVGHGDRVAIAMRNYPEWMQAYWATLSLGAVAVGVNAWWVPDELRYALEDSTPRVFIGDAERLERLAPLRADFPDLAVVGVRTAATDVVPWSELIATAADMPAATVDPDDDACIFYTSGTTGRPKGAQLTHRGCVSNLFNLMFGGMVQAHAIARHRGEAPPDPAAAPIPGALVTTPLFHVTANNCGAYAVTAGGGKLVHMYRWDPAEALALIERERLTSVGGVPVMVRELINHPDFATRDTSSLLALSAGGAQFQPDLVGKVADLGSNARPATGYGMTETCGVITSFSSDFFIDKPDSAGPALPTFEVRCVDEQGRPVAQGELGELCVRGAPVIKGYLNRPDATAETIVDGWLHTGDVARIDEDGCIYIVDRLKDMVLRGGENVYCAEVENALYQHPAVAECSVFGVPDDRLGEEVGAAVVLHSGESVTADELRAHCRERLAAFKAPRYLWFLDDALPRNASGKFLRRELKDRLETASAL